MVIGTFYEDSWWSLLGNDFSAFNVFHNFRTITALRDKTKSERQGVH
jgi:hypothetical protein